MCIVVVSPKKGGYIIGSNRDDEQERKSDNFVTNDKLRGAKYVKDEKGGTWLAIHEKNIYAVLVNDMPSLERRTFSTRGNLPLQVMGLCQKHQGNLEAVLGKVKDSILREEYNSCILAVGGISKGELKHKILYRDAKLKKLRERQTSGHLFLAAPTLYPESTAIERENESKSVKTTNDSIKKRMSEHSYNQDDPKCLQRSGVVTKSKTIIDITNDKIRYNYFEL